MRTRVLVFLLALTGTLAIFYFGGKFISRDETAIVLLTTLFSLFAAIFLLEKFFTTPTNAFVNSFSAAVMLAVGHNVLGGAGAWYWLVVIYVAAILLCSTVAIVLFEWETARARLLSSRIKKLVSIIGSGKALWFVLFFVTLVTSHRLTDGFPTSILLFAAVLAIFDRQLIDLVSEALAERFAHEDLGTIIGVQSQNVFLARLLKTRSEVKLFDHVGFRYTIGSYDKTNTGVVIDRFMLDDERWIRVLQYSMDTTDDLGSIGENSVVKLSKADSDFEDRFVGVVERGSSINEVKFRYLAKAPVLEGQILQAEVNDKNLLFQIVDACTDIEKLEDKNEAGFIVGSAVQLGCWNENKKCFERYGWLPNMMTPVYRADALVNPADDTKASIAEIRDLQTPVNFDFGEGINHHTAIVGVTGSGKSVFARHLIRKAVGHGVKVICIDFTSEYERKFSKLNVVKLSNLVRMDDIARQLREIGSELAEFANKRNNTLVTNNTNAVRQAMRTALQTFVRGEGQILLVDLPDLENTSDMLDFLRNLFIAVFFGARAGDFENHRLAIALEEAHTLVPEHNFISTNDRRMGAVVNAISQIALQGRKYDVGLIVIAQRTANVSKTILTQCNTIFAFQQFDKTSVEFLSSYFGDFAKALPLLAPRNMIVVGKGVRSSVPFIAAVPEIEEDADENAGVGGNEET